MIRKKALGIYLFDPRTFGLSPFPSSFDTIETCLGYQNAKSVDLIGTETVEGTACWHVREQVDTYKLDFSIDAKHPERMIGIAKTPTTGV